MKLITNLAATGLALTLSGPSLALEVDSNLTVYQKASGSFGQSV